MGQHKNKTGTLFTKKYHVLDLVYFEEFNEKNKVKAREKQLKNCIKNGNGI
ncbi:GIY-YIG nuclease family protein [Flavisericum labens]|uniref:hypothetical protein n=1 Tax=Flavisericum labens TaxID=3377112 RepID=UPI00387B99DB